ncbi:MAG TPA: neutral/alkaline non-lysosomal ceramidase N-terminal domain-containing protein [Bryobacteraceae bacterium]|nr:neutral/alkaline non-lysosomal ceramidase N-terminal domain-containing protein [Bryobacteraceae bacterium]
MTRREWIARSLALLPAARMIPGAWSQTGSTSLKAGIAETTITPDWPTPLWGYGGRPPFSDGILDDIFAKAILLDCGKRFLIITMDVGAIGFPLYRRIARRIHETIKIDEDAIMIQCTHDHSAPANIDVTGTDADLRFHELLLSKLVYLASETQRNLAPATLSFGQTESHIARNRRVGAKTSTWDRDSGPIESAFSVVLIQSPEGRNRGVIVNYPTHPVTLRDDNNKISADFPGVLYKELGRSLNCPVMYMQGTCGDMIPKIFGTTREMEEYGRKMAEEAQRALAAAKPLSADSLDFRTQRVVVTFVSPYTLDDFRARYATFFKGQEEKELWAEHLLRFLEDGGDVRQSRDTLVAALRIGDLALAILPGEILHLTATLIRQQFPGRKLMIAAYSNDTSVGYLPNADEFPKGGYEVESAWQYYGTFRTTPQMEKDVRETAIGLLHGLVG